MTDKFMSNWGKAENKIDKLVIECDSYNEALIVENNARNRSEMKYINIRTTRPNYNSKWYQVDWHNKEDYSSWFKSGYFRKQD